MRDGVREAILWESEGDRIRCGVCPRRCLIAEGRRGVCGVREVRDGRLWALTYGRVSSVAVDPIEKKPVFHYRPGTFALSLGGVGCNFACRHCQNWQISRAEPEDVTEQEILSPERVVFLAHENGCEGVAFTYNEPVIWIEYVLDVAAEAAREDLYTVMVTNGFVTPEALKLFARVVDVWRVDVKGIDDETYRVLCQAPSVAPVLDGAVEAKRLGMHVEVVTNVIPTINDSEPSIRGIATWIREALGPDTPWHITRFFPYLELSHLPPTPLDTLRSARAIGIEEGLEYVFLGNVAGSEGEDTECPGCGTIVVSRRGYQVEDSGLDEHGACTVCGRDLGITV